MVHSDRADSVISHDDGGRDWIVTRKYFLGLFCGVIPVKWPCRIVAFHWSFLSGCMSTRPDFWCSAMMIGGRWLIVHEKIFLLGYCGRSSRLSAPCRMAFTCVFVELCHLTSQILVQRMMMEGVNWINYEKKYLRVIAGRSSPVKLPCRMAFHWSFLSGVCRRAIFLRSTRRLEGQGLNSHEEIFLGLFAAVSLRLALMSHGVHLVFFERCVLA